MSCRILPNLTLTYCTLFPCFLHHQSYIPPITFSIEKFLIYLYEKGFKHHTHFYVFKTLHTHSTSYGNGMRKVFTERHAAIIFEGWVLHSVQWTSCTNPEGKLTTPMSKRDVAVRILTYSLSSNKFSVAPIKQRDRISSIRFSLYMYVHVIYRNGLPHAPRAQALQSV